MLSLLDYSHDKAVTAKGGWEPQKINLGGAFHFEGAGDALYAKFEWGWLDSVLF